MRIAISWAGALLGAAATGAVLSAAGRQPDAAGPFTAEQAAAGGAAFQANCAFCHGADLSGGPYAPPLAGPTFTAGWSRRTTRDLVEAIRTMPPSDPGALGDEAHAGLAAYILQANGVDFGPTPLRVTAAASIAALLASRSDAAAPPGAPLLRPSCSPLAARPPGAAPADGQQPRSSSEWPLYGGSAANQRYSTLAQITTGNVAELGGAWMTRLPGPTNQSSVTMSNGRIFAALMNCNVAALDAKTGAIAWVAELAEPPARRGLAVGPDLGFVFVAGASGTISALDMATGEPGWTHPLARDAANDMPLRITSAPTYADGVLLVALAGGDSGRRGGVAALDARAGTEMWRFYAILGPDDVGFETWPNNEMWRAGGGAVWSPPAVDPELGMVYFGTGNPNGNPLGLQGQHPTQHPGPHPSHSGDLRPGDQLFAASVVALDLATGAYRWHFQLTRHDIWDMDVPTPMVLYDTTLDGRPRKGIAVMRTDGYLFLLDRVDGSPLLPVEERPVPQDPFQVTEATQPFPAGGEQVVPNCIEPWLVPPGFRTGCYFDPLNQPDVMVPYIGTRQAPMAYSPQTGYFYVGAAVFPWWATRFGVSYNEPGIRWYGLITAVDSRTNTIAWQRRSAYPKAHGGGMLARQATWCSTARWMAPCRPSTPRPASCCGSSRPAWAPTRPPSSPTSWTASSTSPSRRAAAGRRTGRRWAPARPATPCGHSGSGAPLDRPVRRRCRRGCRPSRGTGRSRGRTRSSSISKSGGGTPSGRRASRSTTTKRSSRGACRWPRASRSPGRTRARRRTPSPFVSRPGRPVRSRPAGTGSIRFDTPGRYVYTCEQHPWQQGEINVVPGQPQESAP